MSKGAPDFDAYTNVERRGREGGLWVWIGAGWEHRDGTIKIELTATPVSGRLSLRTADETVAEASQELPGDA